MMLKIVHDLPGNVAGIEAGGEVTGADYKNILIPAVDKKIKLNKIIHLLYHLGAGFTGFSLKAMIDDAEVGMKNFSACDSVALVSENQLINIFAKYFGYLLPGEVRICNNAGLEDAKKRISEF